MVLVTEAHGPALCTLALEYSTDCIGHLLMNTFDPPGGLCVQTTWGGLAKHFLMDVHFNLECFGVRMVSLAWQIFKRDNPVL